MQSALNESCMKQQRFLITGSSTYFARYAHVGGGAQAADSIKTTIVLTRNGRLKAARWTRFPRGIPRAYVSSHDDGPSHRLGLYTARVRSWFGGARAVHFP
jgi:hypothetical protein